MWATKVKEQRGVVECIYFDIVEDVDPKIKIIKCKNWVEFIEDQ